MASAAYHASENATIKAQVEAVRVALRYHKIHFGKAEHTKLYERFPKVGNNGSWESAIVVTELITKKFESKRPLAAKQLKSRLDAMAKPAQADLSEGTDTTPPEPAEKPVAESVEAPAPIAKENAKDSAEIKVLPIQDLKVGDTFIWDKTSVKKPIRLTIQSIEYGEKGDPQHYNTTLPDGEFISMKLFVPSWKYQGKQVKVVRS